MRPDAGLNRYGPCNGPEEHRAHVHAARDRVRPRVACPWYVGQRVQSKDFCGQWYAARIAAIDHDQILL